MIEDTTGIEGLLADSNNGAVELGEYIRIAETNYNGHRSGIRFFSRNGKPKHPLQDKEVKVRGRLVDIRSVTGKAHVANTVYFYISDENERIILFKKILEVDYAKRECPLMSSYQDIFTKLKGEEITFVARAVSKGKYVPGFNYHMEKLVNGHS